MSTANPATSNTDGVKQTDRTARGPQPDQTPVAPPPGTGGIGVNKIIAGTNVTISPVTGVGNVTINSSAGAGTVTSVTTAGRGATSSPNPIVGAGTITNFDPDVFNVKDYGATGDGSTPDDTAIAAAIAAGEATAKGFCIYFPTGIYACAHRVTIGLWTTQGLMVRGEGMGVSQIYFTNTAADSGLAITSPGTHGDYVSDTPVVVTDLSLICSAANQGTGLSLTLVGAGVMQSTQGTYINRVGFWQRTDGSTYWNIGLDMMNWAQAAVTNCRMGGDTCARIRGTNAKTSVFWFTSCHFQGGTYGIHVDGSGGSDSSNRIEGVKITDCEFIHQTYCIYFYNQDAGGVFQVNGGSMVAATYGVYARGINGTDINGVTINPLGFPNPWTAVHFEYCDLSSVRGCSIAGYDSGGPPTPLPGSGGIYVGGTSTGTTLIGNSFAGMVTALGLDTGTVKCLYDGNVSIDGGLYTNLGTGNVAGTNI
jgi:hypothetical protein